jgi:hypothetical protein
MPFFFGASLAEIARHLAASRTAGYAGYAGRNAGADGGKYYSEIGRSRKVPLTS